MSMSMLLLSSFLLLSCLSSFAALSAAASATIAGGGATLSTASREKALDACLLAQVRLARAAPTTRAAAGGGVAVARPLGEDGAALLVFRADANVSSSTPFSSSDCARELGGLVVARVRPGAFASGPPARGLLRAAARQLEAAAPGLRVLQMLPHTRFLLLSLPGSRFPPSSAAERALAQVCDRFEPVSLSSPIVADRTSSSPRALLRGAKNDVVAAVSGEDFDTVLKQLAGALPLSIAGKEHTIHTRYTYSAENRVAADFIKEWFEGAGGLASEFQEFKVGSTTARNVVGFKNGTKYPDEVVVVGAHYDSTSQTPETLAPGAVDDGSGTAAVMLLSQIFAGVETDRTVVFVTFSGEEQGIYGSKAFVQSGLDKKFKIQNALLMDMISYSKKYFGVIIEGTPKYTELMDAVAYNMRNYGPRNDEEKNALTVNISDRSFGSDHVPFQQAGIPAILGIEADDTNYPNYHRSTDNFSSENVNTTQSVVIIRGMAASLCDLAGCTNKAH